MQTWYARVGTIAVSKLLSDLGLERAIEDVRKKRRERWIWDRVMREMRVENLSGGFGPKNQEGMNYSYEAAGELSRTIKDEVQFYAHVEPSFRDLLY